MTIAQGIARGLRASVTLDGINLSNGEVYATQNRHGTGQGLIEMVGGNKQSYYSIYKQSLWVNICVNKLGRGIGRLPLSAYSSPGNPDEREHLRDGFLADLMRHPSDRHTPFQLKNSIVSNVAVYGNQITVKSRPSVGAPPNQLIPSSFAYWTAEGEDPARPDWWVFNGRNGKRIPFRPEEVIHFTFGGVDPGRIAPSPLEPLRRTLAVEDAAQRTQIASYEHGMRPVGAMSVNKPLRPDVAQRMRDQLTANYGGVDNAFKVLLMEAGAEWLPMSVSLVDAEIINARKLTREEVAAVYDIPPSIIGILDRATFSNISEQHIMLYKDTMGPWLVMIEEALQLHLIDGEPTMRGQYVEFNLNEVLKGDPGARFDAYSKAEFMTPNEKRARENLPPKANPLADAIWMNPGKVPISDDPNIDTMAFVKSAAREKDATAEAPETRRAIDILHCPVCELVQGRNVTNGDFTCRRCKTDFVVLNGDILMAGGKVITPKGANNGEAKTD